MIHLEYPGWNNNFWKDQTAWCYTNFGKDCENLDLMVPPPLTQDSTWYMYYLNGMTHWWFLTEEYAIMFRLRWG